MKNTITAKKGRKPLYFFFTFLFILLLIGSVGIAYATTSYQENAQNTARNDLTANYFAYDGSLSGTATIDADYHALIYNLDGSGINEVIISDDATIYVLDQNAVIMRQRSLSSNIFTQPVIWTDEGTDYLAVMTNTEVFLLNGELTTQYNYSLSNTAIRSSLDCVTNDACYVIYDNTTNTSVVRFNTTIKQETANKHVNISNTKEMAIETNLNDKAYIICDDNNNGDYGICAFDLSSRILDTTFSADGIIDNIAQDDEISAPLTYPFDGGSHEIGISYIDCVASANWDTRYNLASYRSDGTVYNTLSIILLDDRGGCSTASQWSYPTITEIATAGEYYMCGIAEGHPASWIDEQRGLFCFNTGDLSLYNQSFNPDGTQAEYNLISSDFNGDTAGSTDYDDFAWYTGLYDEAHDLIYNLEDTFDSSGADLSIGDIDGDGFTEIVGVTPTNVKILSHASEVQTLQEQITSDTSNNSIRTTLLEVADATGLNLGLTAMWLVVMIFLGYMVWTQTGSSHPQYTFGALAIIETFAMILGMYLGFISVALGVIVLVLAVAVIVFVTQKGQTGGI